MSSILSGALSTVPIAAFVGIATTVAAFTTTLRPCCLRTLKPKRARSRLVSPRSASISLARPLLRSLSLKKTFNTRRRVFTATGWPAIFSSALREAGASASATSAFSSLAYAPISPMSSWK